MKTGASKKMKELATIKRCPRCGRKYALKRADDGGVTYCRYTDCGYERASGMYAQMEKETRQRKR